MVKLTVPEPVAGLTPVTVTFETGINGTEKEYVSANANLGKAVRACKEMETKTVFTGVP